MGCFFARIFRSSVQHRETALETRAGRKRGFPQKHAAYALVFFKIMACILILCVPFLATRWIRTRLETLSSIAGRVRLKSSGTSLHVTVLVMSRGHRMKELTHILAFYLFEHPANTYAVQVHLVWNNASSIPLGEEILNHEKLVVHRESSNTLNNRYRHWRTIKTEAVLLLDDDCLITDLRSALLIHTQPCFKDRLIIFFARTHRVGEKGVSYSNPRSLNGSYSLGTGQATLLSTRWIQAFNTDTRLNQIRDFIDNHRPTCEDIALHMYVSNTSGRPPLLVSSGQKELRYSSTPGMSESKNWGVKRRQCLNNFIAHDFQGKIPLMYSEYKRPVTYEDTLCKT